MSRPYVWCMSDPTPPPTALTPPPDPPPSTPLPSDRAEGRNEHYFRCYGPCPCYRDGQRDNSPSEVTDAARRVAEWLDASRPRRLMPDGSYRFPSGPLWDDLCLVIEHTTGKRRG